MVVVDIPYFKEVVIMSTTCEACGYRNNEVKAGGAITSKGKTITLNVLKKEDLSRDVLKSETASVDIPEIKLHMATGTLGGRFTTIEGLLTNIKNDIGNNPFLGGDSYYENSHDKFKTFFGEIDKFISGEKKNLHLFWMIQFQILIFKIYAFQIQILNLT